MTILRKGKRKYCYKRDKGCCVKCKSTENLTLDHIIPKSLKGGSNLIVNLQTMLVLERSGLRLGGLYEPTRPFGELFKIHHLTSHSDDCVIARPSSTRHPRPQAITCNLSVVDTESLNPYSERVFLIWVLITPRQGA